MRKRDVVDHHTIKLTKTVFIRATESSLKNVVKEQENMPLFLGCCDPQVHSCVLVYPKVQKMEWISSALERRSKG